MRARKNQTAGRVLSYLAGRDAMAREVSSKLRLGQHNIAATLNRLYKQECVDRNKVEDGEVVIDQEEKITRKNYCFMYSITEKGRERLERIVGGK